MKKLFLIFVVLAVGVIGFYLVRGATPPKPKVTFEGHKIEVAQGSYCWNGLVGTKCEDMISPPDIIKHHEFKPVIVPPGSKIRIEFSQEPEANTLNVSRWLSSSESENISLSNNKLIVPKEKGVYIYDVFARWKKGDSSYAFAIEVK